MEMLSIFHADEAITIQVLGGDRAALNPEPKLNIWPDRDWLRVAVSVAQHGTSCRNPAGGTAFLICAAGGGRSTGNTRGMVLRF